MCVCVCVYVCVCVCVCVCVRERERERESERERKCETSLGLLVQYRPSLPIHVAAGGLLSFRWVSIWLLCSFSVYLCTMSSHLKDVSLKDWPLLCFVWRCIWTW